MSIPANCFLLRLVLLMIVNFLSQVTDWRMSQAALLWIDVSTQEYVDLLAEAHDDSIAQVLAADDLMQSCEPLVEAVSIQVSRLFLRLVLQMKVAFLSWGIDQRMSWVALLWFDASAQKH